MGLFDIFKKKKDSRDQLGMTLAELVEKVKKEGYSEREIRQQMVKKFGKEQLKSFGEGVTISSLKVGEMIKGLREQREKVSVEHMTPFELVTHLLICLQLADGRMDFEEREVLAEAVSDLFPDHSYDHVIEVMRSSGKIILEMDVSGRKSYAVDMTNQLRNHFSHKEIQSQILPKLIEMIEADGVVTSSESNMIDAIKMALQIGTPHSDDQ